MFCRTVTVVDDWGARGAWAIFFPACMYLACTVNMVNTVGEKIEESDSLITHATADALALLSLPYVQVNGKTLGSDSS